MALDESQPTSPGAIDNASTPESSPSKVPVGRDSRADFGCTVAIRSSGHGIFPTGEVENISVSGMQVHTEHPHPCGAILQLEFTLPLDDGVTIQCCGEVVWSEEQRDHPVAPHGIGLRFQDLDEVGQHAIQALVRQTHGMPLTAPTRRELLEQLSKTEAEVQRVTAKSKRIDVRRLGQLEELGKTTQANIEARRDLERRLGGGFPARDSGGEGPGAEGTNPPSPEGLPDLGSTKEMLRRELFQIQETLAESGETTSLLESRLLRLEDSFGEPEQGSGHLEKAVESAQRQTNELLAALEETNDSLLRSQEARVELEKRLAESSSPVTDEDRLNDLEELNTKLRVDLARSRTRATTAQADSTEHLLRVEDLESSLSGLRREIDDLSRKSIEHETLLSTELDQARSELRETEKTRARLEAELERSESEDKEYTKRIAVTLETVRKALAAQHQLAERGRFVAETMDAAKRAIDALDAGAKGAEIAKDAS